MLFSNDQVAAFINKYFEPAWESVRPVPLVHIDFGNGTVLTRTLHGNIATYACTAEGQTLDVLGGIYTPAKYVERLNQFRLLANYVDLKGKGQRAARLAEYHKGQLEALARKEPPPRLMNRFDRTKRFIENRVEAILVKGRRPAKDAEPKTEKPKLDSPEDAKSWAFLLEDTRANETIRRKQVHELLLKRGPESPAALKKTIYKDILHADLDDPYLGLGDTLFANYPFKDED